MGYVEQNFRLTNEPGGLGLSCTEAGLSLAGAPLLRKSDTGFARRSTTEIEALIQAAYSGHIAVTDLLPGINAVVRALNRGELARAMTAAVLMKLPALDWQAAARLAHAEDRISKYRADELRDWLGRWTIGIAADGGSPDGEVEPDNVGPGDEAPDQGVQPRATVDTGDEPDETELAPPDDRPPLERKYDDLGPVEFSKKVTQFGLSLGAEGQGFSTEQRQDALAEYNFLQDRLNFWIAYDDKPIGAQQNLHSAALNLYTGAVNGGVVPVGGKGGNLPASMVAAATDILAADNRTPIVGLRGPAGGVEVEPEPAPREHEPDEEESVSPQGQLAPGRTAQIIEELTRTGELGEVISNDDAKIGWDGGTNKGLDWEAYNETQYPEITRLQAGSKAFDFFDEATGEAISDKALDPLCYSYINNPQIVYSTVKGYIKDVAGYNKQRAWLEVAW